MIIFLLLLVIVLAGLAIGWNQGLVSQLGSLAGIVLGIILARLFGGPLAAALIDGEPEQKRAMLTILAYASLFLIAYVSARVVAYICREMIRLVRLGLFDRLGGAVFKVLEWVFIFSLLLNLWIVFEPDQRPEGVWGERVQAFAPAVMGSESAQELIEAVNI